MTRYREDTIFDMSQRALMYVVKYGDRYLGEEGLVEDLEDARAFLSYSDATEAQQDLVQGMDLIQELPDGDDVNPYGLSYFIKEEQDSWGEDYDSEEKGPYGLIDEWDARKELESRTSVVGIYATSLKE